MFEISKEVRALTLTLLTWTIWRAPINASKWRMGFNSAFKVLNRLGSVTCHGLIFGFMFVANALTHNLDGETSNTNRSKPINSISNATTFTNKTE